MVSSHWSGFLYFGCCPLIIGATEPVIRQWEGHPCAGAGDRAIDHERHWVQELGAIQDLVDSSSRAAERLG
jgi:hypothetical protein